MASIRCRTGTGRNPGGACHDNARGAADDDDDDHTTTTTTTPATPPAAAGTPLATCRHPQLGTADPTATSDTPADGYVTWRDPFVYFGSLVSASTCAENDVGIGQLGTDLASGHIPSLSWIAPDLCTSGITDACPMTDTVTGTAAADAFLKRWIPQIEATSDYKNDGMIVIVSDQAPASGTSADSSACCGQIHYLNTSNAGGTAHPGPGGGLVGALVISKYAGKGVTDSTPSDHYTLLRTLEDVFKVKPLGFATKRQPFDQTVFPTESGGGGAVTT